MRAPLKQRVGSTLHIGIVGNLTAGHGCKLQYIGLETVKLPGKRGEAPGIRCGDRVGKDRYSGESIGGNPFKGLRRQAGITHNGVRLAQFIPVSLEPVGGDMFQNTHIGHTDEHISLGVDERHIAGAAAVRAAQHVRHIHADRLAGGEDLAAV